MRKNVICPLALVCITSGALHAEIVTHIAPGATYRYVDATAATLASTAGISTAGWTLPGYDDSQWFTGAAPFGNTAGGDFGANTQWDVDYDPLLRTSITLLSPAQQTVYLGVDNGFVMYVNGVQVASANAGGFTSRWEYIFTIPADRFVAGTNTIAIALDDYGGLTAFDMMIEGPVPAPGALALMGVAGLAARRRRG